MSLPSSPLPCPCPLDAWVDAREAINVRVNTPPRQHRAVWPICRCTRRVARKNLWWINSSVLRTFVEHRWSSLITYLSYRLRWLVHDDVVASYLASNSWDAVALPHPQQPYLPYYIVDLQKTLLLILINCTVCICSIWQSMHIFLHVCAWVASQLYLDCLSTIRYSRLVM